ncbi:MAG: sugar-phosphate isomerase, RpiB/LacA/LacB family [Clostridia bacterium]|nr:sugar-phosphate isomerase, RpiB/LacA/LacB family [Clostridia bacterium]
MKIAIGSDHGGFVLKAEILKHIQSKGYEIKDFGCYSVESIDYPDVAHEVAGAVIKGEYDKGILICGTGIGISIAANKIPGIRAALCGDCFSAKASREHNDSNILALGERVTGVGLAKMITDIWLATEFEGGRHTGRVNKISDIECKYNK